MFSYLKTEYLSFFLKSELAKILDDDCTAKENVNICVLFTGVPAVIVAVGFAIKTEVYDGRDDDCVFR